MTYTIYYIHNNRMAMAQHITQHQLPEVLRAIKRRGDKILLIKDMFGNAINIET